MTAETTAAPDPTIKRCAGSTTFGIEPHDAPRSDFPAQPSQKDGLGRMCKPHWNQYTTALRKASLAKKANDQAADQVTESPALVTDAEGTQLLTQAGAERALGKKRVAKLINAGPARPATQAAKAAKPAKVEPMQHAELLDPPGA